MVQKNVPTYIKNLCVQLLITRVLLTFEGRRQRILTAQWSAACNVTNERLTTHVVSPQKKNSIVFVIQKNVPPYIKNFCVQLLIIRVLLTLEGRRQRILTAQWSAACNDTNQSLTTHVVSPQI